MGKNFTSLALLFQRQLLLGGQSLSSLQSLFSFAPRISQGSNTSRQSSEILPRRCQLMGKGFTALARLRSGLRLGGRNQGIFRGSSRSICAAMSSDLLALNEEYVASLALLFQC